MYTPAAPMVGDDVSSLQQQLTELGYDLGRADHLFGPITESALRGFQRDFGLRPDGICGPSTLRALKQLARRVVGGRPQLLRDMAAVATAGPNLPGKRIVIDPGHGGADTGAVDRWDPTITEAALVWDVAARLEGRLLALGATALLTRGATSGPSDEERAGFANSVDADLVISLHVDSIDSAHGNGVAAYYYGTSESASWIGERLADLAQREIVARTGMQNDRTHAKTWTLLRLTRMPAVRLELGYLSSPIDRERLLDPGFRDTVAEALLVAVQRLYLPTESDQPTGVMQISAAGLTRLAGLADPHPVVSQEVRDASDRLGEILDPRQGHDAQMIGRGPVEARSLHDQDVLFAQQLQDELLIVLDRVDLRIQSREHVQRALGLDAADARDGPQSGDRGIALGEQPPAGQDQVVDRLPSTQGGLDRVLARDVGAQPHVRQDRQTLEIAAGVLPRTGDHQPARPEPGQPVRLRQPVERQREHVRRKRGERRVCVASS